MKSTDVMEYFDEEVQRLEILIKNLHAYREKLERRVASDYAGKDDKLRSIAKDISQMEGSLSEAVKKLKSNVG